MGIVHMMGCAWAYYQLTHSRWAGVKALAGQKLLLVDIPDAHPPLRSTTHDLHAVPLTPVCTQVPDMRLACCECRSEQRWTMCSDFVCASLVCMLQSLDCGSDMVCDVQCKAYREKMNRVEKKAVQVVATW